MRRIRRTAGSREEHADSDFEEELKRIEVSLSEGENSEEDIRVGRQTDLDERDEEDKLIGVKKSPQRLKRNIPKLNKNY